MAEIKAVYGNTGDIPNHTTPKKKKNNEHLSTTNYSINVTDLYIYLELHKTNIYRLISGIDEKMHDAL